MKIGGRSIGGGGLYFSWTSSGFLCVCVVSNFGLFLVLS
jgi:hypothetical protein